MRLVASLAALFLVFTLVTCTDGQGCSTCGKNRSKRSMEMNVVLKSLAYRLPGDLRPISYDLEIKPDIAKAKFDGQVNITAVWTTGGTMIKLNADEDLNIQDVRVRLLGVEDAAAGIDVAGWKFISQKSELVIGLAQIMKPKDICLVHIKYSGNITTNNTAGFFKREYMTSSGQTHAFLATQMRPEYARRFFPCLDEPEYKATFELRVARPKNMMARSNTPIKMSVEMPGDPEYVMDHFEKTPEMATYQLALMISDFESITPTIPIDSIEGSKLEVRVWGRKEYLDSLAHVPNKIVRILNYIQKYMGKSIGLPKLDIVAMPMYTAAKASDSWGLMFFRESELSSSLVWNTAYELIYQWIGQQYTPLKWNAYLLNKALNSFLASVTTVDIEPDEMEGKWPMTMLYSLYYEFGKTFPFSRVAGIRNEATSAKAELVFRMFNYTLGAKRFKEGVRKLIRQEKQTLQTDETEVVRSFYANDIFKHLDEVVNETNFNLPSHLTIESIATPWYFRDRVPLVTVIRDYSTGQTGQITLSQSVYLREAAPPSNNQMSSQWDIPIVMITQDEIEAENIASTSEYKPHTWMTKAGPPTMTIKDIAKPEKFIIVNPEEIGMFPVKYDTCNWKKLGTFLQGPDREKIPVLTRAKLVHDSWNLAYAGNLCFGVALNMTLFLKNERSHVVWEPVFAMIDHVGRRIEGSPVHIKFEAYICSLLKPLYAELGETSMPGEPLWKVHMRGLVKNFLCRAGYEPCVTEAREQFKKWMTDDEPDKGNPVANEYICPVFRWGTQEEWEFGLQRVINFPRNTLERKENERTYLLKTLAGCPKDKSKIERLLNVTILSHYVNFTDSDIHLIYSMLTGGAIGHSTLFNFLKDHWQLIKTRFEVKRHLWNGIINSATSSFNTQEGYDMVSELYESRKGESKAEDEVLEKALKNIEKETEWNHQHLPVINEWLDAHLNKEDLANVETTLSPLSTSDAPVSTVSPSSSSSTIDDTSSSSISTSSDSSSSTTTTSDSSSSSSSSSSISTSVKPFAG